MVLKTHKPFLWLSWLTVLALLLAACGGASEPGNQGAGASTPTESSAQPSASAGEAASSAPETTQASPSASAAPSAAAAAPSASSEGGDTSGAAVTLRYALWNQNQVPAMEQIIAAFKESNPNIDVAIELTPFDQYWTKLEAAATGGSLPDLFWMNGPNFVKYASNEILMPLNDQIAADGVDLTNYPQALVDLYTYEDTRYALPKDFDTIGLWYNKELFDAAGVAYPDDTWTWDSVREAAQQLTNAEQGVWGIAARMVNQEGYYNTIYQNGGYVISPDKTASGYDQPATIEALQYWTDMIEQGFSPTQAQMTETNPLDLFQSGKVTMLYGGSWRQIQFAENEYTRDRVDVTVLPQGQQRAVIIHGLGNVISAQTQYPEEAWEFLKFLGSQEAAQIQAETGAVIPAFNGAQQTWVESNTQFNLQVFLDQLEYAVPYPVSANTAEWQSAETEMLTQAWAGQMPVQDAATQLAQRMNEVLQQE